MRDAWETDELRQEMKESMNDPVELLNSQMIRLSLIETPFQTFTAAEGQSIGSLWEKCTELDSDVQVLSNS